MKPLAMPASKPLRHFMLEATCSLSVFLVVLSELLNWSVVPYAHGLPSVIKIGRFWNLILKNNFLCKSTKIYF